MQRKAEMRPVHDLLPPHHQSRPKSYLFVRFLKVTQLLIMIFLFLYFDVWPDWHWDCLRYNQRECLSFSCLVLRLPSLLSASSHSRVIHFLPNTPSSQVSGQLEIHPVSTEITRQPSQNLACTAFLLLFPAGINPFPALCLRFTGVSHILAVWLPSLNWVTIHPFWLFSFHSEKTPKPNTVHSSQMCWVFSDIDFPLWYSVIFQQRHALQSISKWGIFSDQLFWFWTELRVLALTLGSRGLVKSLHLLSSYYPSA